MANIKKHLIYFSHFATGQFLLQAFNILNGFFLLRWLSIQEQAKFSVAFGIQSLILSLSDLGFTGSIIALVGNRIDDKKIVGSYIQSAKRLRNYLFFFSCAVTLVILPFIIRKQAWGYIDLALILTPVLLAVFWQADCSLYDSTLVMHKKMKEFYKPQVALASVKLIINYVLYFTGIIGAFTTLTLNAITLLINGKTYKKNAAPYVDISADNKYDVQFKEMINYLKPLFPSLIFNAFYGQIQIFLISFFGKTTSIAEIAALGKLSQMFLFLGTINSTILVPYIAKSENKEVTKKYFAILGVSLCVVLCIYLTSVAVPGLFLFVLGPKYYHLRSELSVMIMNACLSYIGGVMWSMHSARKWVFWWGTWSYIFCVITCQVVGIMIFDISTTHGVLCISTLTLACMLLVHGFTAAMGFNKLKYDLAG